MKQETYDVAVLGSGLGGAVLAAILGRRGFRVLLLEKGTHPRFAIGEAMLPQSSMLLWILGERFDVPEIQNLSSTERIPAGDLGHPARGVALSFSLSLSCKQNSRSGSPGRLRRISE